MIESETDGSYRIGVLDRIDTILIALAKQPARTAELAERVGLEPKTTYRLVRSLEGKGYVRRLPDKRYAPGYALLRLARAVVEHPDLLEVSRPVLMDIVQHTNETGFLTVREGDTSVCVDLVGSPQPLRLSVNVGARRPLPVGAVGKVLLCYAPQPVRDLVLSRELPTPTEQSITDADELRRQLDRTREQGYATSDSENTVGAGSIAAPIHRADGEVVAVLAVGGPNQRVLTQNFDANLIAVLENAERLSRLLRIRAD